MQKLLLSIILAMFLALALVGVKRTIGPAATSAASGTTMMAAGTAPQPPIPW